MNAANSALLCELLDMHELIGEVLLDACETGKERDAWVLYNAQREVSMAIMRLYYPLSGGQAEDPVVVLARATRHHIEAMRTAEYIHNPGGES